MKKFLMGVLMTSATFGSYAQQISGNMLFSPTGGGARILRNVGNTAANPAIGFSGFAATLTTGSTQQQYNDVNGGNGIFRPAANTMAFATMGLQRMSLSPNGQLSIAPGASPFAKLYVETNWTNDGIQVNQTGTSAATLDLNASGGGGKRWALFSTGSGNSQGAGHLLFFDWSLNTERMRITNLGQVQIGQGPNSISKLFNVKGEAWFEESRVVVHGNINDDAFVVQNKLQNVPHEKSLLWLAYNAPANQPNNPFLLQATGANAVDRFVVRYEGNVGINTSEPTEKLDVIGNIKTTGFILPTNAGVGKVLTSDANGVATWQAPASAFWTTSGVGTNNVINSNAGGIIIGTGITSTPTGYKLYVSDGILTEKVKVAVKNSANWADYVFNPEYKLKPLAEVETFVKTNKHLPNIPSAETLVKEGGIDVNEMFSLQMAKIEELTLYLIDMQKQLDALKAENNELKEDLENTPK